MRWLWSSFTSLLCVLFYTASVCAFVEKNLPPAHGTRRINPRTVPLTSNTPSGRFRISSSHKQYQRSSRCKLSSSQSDDDIKDRALGISVLLTVPLAWGTYTPVVKYLYEIQPPVPGFVFSAAYYLVASALLWPLVLISAENDTNSSSLKKIEDDHFPFAGGIELGSYLFIGNALQVLGLESVPADRAGFLVQLTTVMVPFAQAFSVGDFQSISTKTWLSCLLAFCGVVVMGIDGKDLTQDETFLSAITDIFSGFTQGDFLIILAAVAYTMHVVRLGRYARETTPLKLAASKATAETFLSFGLVTGLYSFANSLDENAGMLGYASKVGLEIRTFFSSITESISTGAIPTSTLLPAIGAVLWTGCVTCAYTIYAQSFGQRRVSPTEANLIYTVQPLFTAIFAWVLLGETLGPAGATGGALIASAVYMVAMTDGEGNGDIKTDIEVVPDVKINATDSEALQLDKQSSKETVNQ